MEQVVYSCEKYTIMGHTECSFVPAQGPRFRDPGLVLAVLHVTAQTAG